MKDDLVVFTDVITPSAHTIPAVMGALCSEKLKRGEISCPSATLLDIARGVGYKVTWISNQTQVGFDDSSLVQLGKSADQSYFVNRDASSAGEADRNTSLDEKVLAPLEETLAAQAKDGQKNMIFIHLMGTHFTYEKRYPETANIFSDDSSLELPLSVTHKDAKSLINHYDNAVAYQDKLLGTIFAKIKVSNQAAVGIYLSDHGEEVFDTKNFHGHSDDNLTPAMSEIPFIFGASDVYAQAHQADLQRFRLYQNRPFISNQLTPSVADLLGLRYDALKLEQSLFSAAFKPGPRETSKGLYESAQSE